MNVQELPEEIRLTVFASLPPKDLLVASLVCKEVCQSHSIRKEFAASFSALISSFGKQI
jgi:hypothetical protein